MPIKGGDPWELFEFLNIDDGNDKLARPGLDHGCAAH